MTSRIPTPMATEDPADEDEQEADDHPAARPVGGVAPPVPPAGRCGGRRDRRAIRGSPAALRNRGGGVGCPGVLPRHRATWSPWRRDRHPLGSFGHDDGHHVVCKGASPCVMAIAKLTGGTEGNVVVVPD